MVHGAWGLCVSSGGHRRTGRVRVPESLGGPMDTWVFHLVKMLPNEAHFLS